MMLMMSKKLQDSRVTDHRLKMNFSLTSFLDGGLEDAVQVESRPKTQNLKPFCGFTRLCEF